MPQPEDDVPLAKLVATSSGPSDPDHSAAPTCKEDQATPAPATRQLRHTRSQSARKAPAAPGSTDAKAKQAAEGEEPEGVVKQDQPVESQQESAAAAASEPDAAVHDASAALAEADKDQPAASAKNSKSTEAVGPTAEPEESDITDITPSGIGRGGRGRVRGGRGRGKGRTKSKGRAKAAGNTSPKAPSEDQADFANELDSPSRNASDAADQSIQLEPSREDVSISKLSEGDHQQASQAAKGNSQLLKGNSDASQASGPHASLKSQTSKADNLTVTQPDDVKAPEVDEPKASKLDESRASRMEEPRASGLEEPPAKRPRRAAAANTGQKEPKEVNNGRGKEGNNGKAKEVMTGKAKGRGTQAKRGVVQESDTDDTEDIDIGDQEEDVDIGTNNEPYEQSVAAEDMEIDEKPQAQAGKKRPRKPEELPSGKGRPKPNPSTAKGPGPGAAKAGKGSAEGSGPAAKPGKGTSVAPAPTRAGPKEKRPGSGKHEASQAATNASPGDIAKQAAEVQKGVLKDAMKVFDDTRQAFEDARQALAEAADQVETSLSSIGQLSGLTMDILRDTLLGKEVGKLNKLARLHPTITDCERISSKASEVTTILKRAVGLPTQGPGQQPQGPSQQPKKPVPKADSRLTSPASPVMARTASATAAAPASAPAVATDPAAAAAAAAAHPLPDQMPGTSNGPEKLGESGHQQAARDVAVKQQPADVKTEPASQASSPANRPVAGAAQAGAGAAPGKAPNLRADLQPAVDTAQPIPAGSQQQLKPAGKLPLAKAQHAIPSATGTAGQPRGDSVRGKAVAILGLALTSPTDLTPHEAAVALEAAVFAHFAEHGEPGMRYKRRLHALWSYLRGTDQAPAVSQLRQKVLQGEIMTKTLAKIDRAQAQHLCNLKSNGTQRPPPQHAQQAQSRHQLPFQQQQQQQLPPPQLQQQQPPLYASQQQQQQQQQQKTHQVQDPTAAAQQHQKLHPWQQASAAAPVAAAAPLPYSTPGAYSYEAAAMYQQPWHHPHQQPYGVAAPVLLPTQQMLPPGATLPPAQAQAATAVPPPPPAGDPLPSTSSSGQMAAAPPPPTDDPPEFPASPPPPQSTSSVLLQAAASQPPAGTSNLASSSAMPGPDAASVAAPHASPRLAPRGPVIDPSADALSATATTRTSDNHAGAASQAVLEAGLRNETNLDASTSMRQHNHGPSAQAAPVWLPPKGLKVRDSPASFSKIDNDFGSDSDRPPGVDDESTMSDAMDRT